MPAIITKKEIEKVLSIKDVVKVVEKAFRLHGLNRVQMPAKSYLDFGVGDLRSMPAFIDDKSMYMAGIKSVNVHPDNPRKYRLPTVMATILLTDPKTGYNIAILDGTLITNLRTGAAGAVAAKYLSKKDSKIAGFIGTGAQARTQLDALMTVRKIKQIKAWSPSKKSMAGFCTWAEKNYGINVIPSDDIKGAVQDCDIVTTVTPSRKPLVKKDWIASGTHINAIGADAKGKEELDPKLLKAAKVVIDDWNQASHSGEINVPISKGLFSKKDVYAQLGQIVAGKKRGRTSNKEITIFDSTGLAIQDISTAYLVYKKIKAKGKLREIKLF